MTKRLIRSSLPVILAGLILCVVGPVNAAGKDTPATLDKDPHLVGWWKLDETSGKTAADSSGHKRKGTLKEDL
ncbi:MAG TPA: hypothetical protein ENI81_08335, partial [Phycisphaerales bacterium]|nr:hypothetical protein [Phycisphaerales bacterium]